MAFDGDFCFQIFFISAHKLFYIYMTLTHQVKNIQHKISAFFINTTPCAFRIKILENKYQKEND
jgi:hypothetical protein